MTPGDRLAERFELRQPLGRGGTGEVWEAWDHVGDRTVAVKLLHEGLLADPVARGELESAVAAAGRLVHPAIVEVYGLWTHGNHRLLVSERVTGSPLASAPRLSLEDALVLTLQVAEALERAHRNKRVHGDLRPGNVLCSPTGARVFDFGVGSPPATAVVRDSTIRPGETAPEVVDGGPASPAADLYGLGVILVRAATGVGPFDRDTPYASLTAQRAGPPALSELPRGVRSLARALLEPEPDLRPADAAAVVRALARLRRHPGRVAGFGGRWFAPIRPLRAWVVHGRDPATGGPAVIRAGLGRAPAQALVERLRSEGWQVEASREALDVTDLVWAGTAGLVASVASPFLGFGLMTPLVLRWRSAGVRDRLREVLPAVRAPLPPRRLPPGNEVAVAAGFLLFALAASLVFAPPLALPLLAGLVWLAAASWRAPVDRGPSLARRGRVETALAEAHALLEAGTPDLDVDLGLYGEWVALDRAWRAGELAEVDLLDRVDGLSARVRAAQAPRIPGPLRADGPEGPDAP